MKKFIIITSLFLFFLPFICFANGPSIQLFHPVLDEGGGLTLYDNTFLKKQDWRLGFFANYGHAPLQINSVNASEGLFTLDATFAFGLYDWLELGFAIPFAIRQEVSANYTNQLNASGLHDFFLTAKIKILEESKHHIGLSFMPRAFLPTGEDASFLGDKGGSYGGWFVLDKHYKNFTFIFNTGTMFRPYENQFNNLTLSHQLDYGVGAIYTLTQNFLSLKTELTGSTPLNKLFQETLTSPLQLYSGIETKLKQGLKLTIGSSFGLTDAYGTPDWRVLFGVQYLPTIHDDYKIKQRQTPPTTFVIHFPFNNAVIQLDSYPILSRVVSIINHSKNEAVINIQGQADGIGDKKTNLKLANQRAKALYDTLITQGLKADQLKITEPLIHNPCPEKNHPVNMSHRKAVLHIDYSKQSPSPTTLTTAVSSSS